MSAVQQYIDLYRSQKSLIEAHSSEVMNGLRGEAVALLESRGLTSLKDEEHRRTEVESIYAPDYGLNLGRIEIEVNPYEVFRCDVPNLSTLLYFIVNDSFYQSAQPAAAKLPDGVLVGSLREMSAKYPQLVSRYYGQVADMKRDGTVALNTAFAQDGFFLYVPDGVVVEKPIQLVNILQGSNVDFMVNRRLLIVVGKGAQAKLLVCDHSDDATVKFLSSQVCEIFVDDDAVFDYYDMEESSENTSKVASVFVRQGARSNVLVNGIVLHNGVTRSNYYTTFAGEQAELLLCGMAIADKEQSVDTYTYIDHAVSHCHLATSLEIYVSGSLNVFNHKTNVDLNRRLVCLDLKKLGAGLRTIAMLIMQDLVNSQVSLNFLRGIATWCYFDEFHVLLRDPLTASYCVSIWKMLRKKGCVPSALTQNVKDFLASPEIENIFENSDFLVLLSQAQGDRQILAKQLGISPHQLSYVTHTNSGEGLLFFGNTTIPFVDHFPQNTELYAIMTTRPEDKKREPGKGA